MSTMTATSGKAAGMTKDERFVILASSLGTVFEWYDFYLYGSLASVIGAQVFSDYPPAPRHFRASGLRRRFLVADGAVVFGRVGDIVGRKYTSLVTILIMGLSTSSSGCSDAATIGIAAPIILITCACSRASRLAASMAARRPTSPNMRRWASVANTPRSFRPRPPSACSCPCW